MNTPKKQTPPVSYQHLSKMSKIDPKYEEEMLSSGHVLQLAADRLKNYYRDKRDFRERKKASYLFGLGDSGLLKRDRESYVLERRYKRCPVMFSEGVELQGGMTSTAPKWVRASSHQSVPYSPEHVSSLEVWDELEGISLQGGATAVATSAITVVGMILFSKIKKLLNKTNGVADKVSDLVSTFSDMVKMLKKAVKCSLWVVPLFLVVKFLLPRISSELRVFVVGALGIAVGSQVWDFFRVHFDDNPIAGFKNDDSVNLQSGLGSCGFGKLIAACLCFSVFRGKSRERNITEFQKRVSVFDRFAESWDSLSDWACKVLDDLLMFCADRFGTPRVKWFHREKTPLMTWATKVDQLIAKSVEEARVDPSALTYMIQLYREGNVYLEKFQGTKTHRVVSEYVAKIANYMMPFAGAINARNNFRMEPLAIMLLGDPGIGKTLMLPFLATALLVESGAMPRTATRDEIMREVWQKGASTFWNGYAEQKVLVIDDAFQKRVNPSDEESDYLNFIKMVSSFACPLNFADLASKGKIYFLSQLIIGTTNLSCLREQAEKVIIEPAAVTRRITFPLKLTVAPKFAKPDGKLDYDLFLIECERTLNASDMIDRFPWHVWNVANHDFLGNEADGNAYSLKLAIGQMVNKFRERIRQQGDVENRLDSFINGRPPPAEVVIDIAASLPASGVAFQGSSIVVQQEIDEAWREFVTDARACINGPLVDQPPPGEILPMPDAPALSYSLNEFDTIGANRAVSEYKKKEMEEFYRAPKGLIDKLFWAYDRDMEAAIESNMWWTKWTVSAKWMLFITGGYYVLGSAIRVVFRSVFGAISGTVKSLFKCSERHSYAPKTVNVQSNRVEVPRVRTKRDAITLQSFDEPIPTSVRANTYTLSVDGEISFHHLGSVTFLMDNMAVQPEHFTQVVRDGVASGKWTEATMMTFAHNEAGSFSSSGLDKRVSNYKVSFSIGHYLSLKRFSLEGREIEFISFPSMRSHTAIQQYYITESDVRSISGLSATACLYRPMSQDTFYRVFQPNLSLNYQKDQIADGKCVKHVLAYKSDTRAGDCGAPIILTNVPHFGPKQCVGFHVMGNPLRQQGFSTILTQEDIQKGIVALRPIVDKLFSDAADRGVTLDTGFDLPFFGGSMLPIGTVKEKANLTSKSKFFKTSLYGQWGDYTYEPAHMKPVMVDGVKVYPMVKALEPYTTPVLIYECPQLEQAMYLAVAPFNALTTNFPKRIYSFEEAVLGVPNEKFRAIPRSTSAGYPECIHTARGKKDFFGDSEDYDLTTPKCLELRDRVEYILSSAARGERLSHFFMDFLKDELRSPAKNAEVATRLISCAPLDYTVAWRQMFGAYSAAMFRVNTVSGMAPGICTFSDWSELARLLRSRGEACFDGDFKGFDSSEQPTIHNLALRMINEWYNDGPINARVREVLWCDLVHSRHITGLGNDQRYIVQWNKSLPSGHPFTTIINSIYSLFLLIATYIHITEDWTGFWRNVFSVTYGDDNVSNVSDTVKDVFNQTTVSQAMRLVFGLTYTSAEKNAVLGTYSTLQDMSFLKRGFHFENNYVLCPLEVDSFLYTPYWCKNKRLEQDILVDTLENALEELSIHSVEKWNEHSPPIVEELLRRSTCEVPLPRAYPTRSSYQKLVLSRTDNWY